MSKKFLTKTELYQLYLDSNKEPDTAALRLLQSLNLEHDENSIEKAKELFRVHAVKRKSQLRDWQQHHRLSSWYKEEISIESLSCQLPRDNQHNFSTADDNNESEPPQYSASTIKFSQLTLEQKRYQTKNITEKLQSTAVDNNLSINQLIGYLLYRVNYHSNRTFAETGQTMEENGDFTATAKLSVNETIAMQSYLDLSKHDLRLLKAILDDKVHVPNTTDVLHAKKCLRPDLNECRDSRGIMIKSRRDVVIRTVQRLIDVAKSQGKQIPQTLLYNEKTGHDGAGTMPIYHSHNNLQRESNIFSKLFTPLSLASTLTGNVI